jgi:hypothetical protein
MNIIKFFHNNTGKIEKALCQFDAFNGGYTLTLLGGELNNTHGEGRTINEAISVLKMNINQKLGIYKIMN